MNEGILVTNYGDANVLKYQALDMPFLEANQVLIRTAAASVNFADIKARIGKFHSGKKLPFIPGIDLAGTVEAIGSEVKSLKVGQRVMAFASHGSYQKYAVSNENTTFPISDKLDFETAAACLTVSFTSYALLVQCAKLQRGESVLIHAAAGGVGTTASQLAKLLGAKTVIGTIGSDEKVDIAKKSGVDHVINYNKENFVEEVLKITDNKGVDIILDSLSGETFEESLKCLSFFGRIVNFGNAKETSGGQVRTSDLHSSCRSVIGYSLGTTLKYRPESLKTTAAEVLPYIESGKLKMFIDQSFKLEEAALAHEWIESRKSKGKVLLVP